MIRSQLRFSLLVTLAALGLAPAARADDKPIRALLVAGGCCHDYKHQKDILTQGISARANVEWVIAYDPDGSTSHLNPVYEKDDWAKGFDVIVHDECSADVKDLKAIDRILKPHREGLPAVVAALRHALLSQRGLAAEGDSLVRVHRAAFDRPRGPGADRRHVPRQGQPHHQALAGLDDDQRGALQQQRRQAAGNGPAAGPRQADGQQMSSTRSGRTPTTARRGSSARRWGTTTPPVDDSRYLDLVTRGLLWSVDKLDAAHLKPAKKVLLD